MYTGLYLDDDYEKLVYLAEVLEEFTTLEIFTDPRIALKTLEKKCYDFMVIDINMPIMNGLEFIKVLKSSKLATCSNLFILSTMQDNETKIKGLSLGVKDYLSFDMTKEEIQLRIKNHLENSSEIVTHYQGLRLDKECSSLILDDKEVYLTPTEYRIVTHLFRVRGEEKDIENLMKSVWNDAFVSKQTFNTHISNLNRKTEVLNTEIRRTSKSGLCLHV